jgi:hypothetical protein
VQTILLLLLQTRLGWWRGVEGGECAREEDWEEGDEERGKEAGNEAFGGEARARRDGDHEERHCDCDGGGERLDAVRTFLEEIGED